MPLVIKLGLVISSIALHPLTVSLIFHARCTDLCSNVSLWGIVVVGCPDSHFRCWELLVAVVAVCQDVCVLRISSLATDFTVCPRSNDAKAIVFTCHAMRGVASFQMVAVIHQGSHNLGRFTGDPIHLKLLAFMAWWT